MVEEIISDIFLAPINILIHQCNCQCTMASGIAAIIKEKFPDAYQIDRRTKKGDKTKLGSYTSVRIVSAENPNLKWILNLYSQFDFGRTTKHTDYDALHHGLMTLKIRLESGYREEERPVVGIPHRIGSDSAGGDWRVVRAIIDSVFEKSPVKVLICKHPDADKKPLVNTASQ